MSDNAMLAIIISVLITSCGAQAVAERFEDPKSACIRGAWTQADRMQCMECKP